MVDVGSVAYSASSSLYAASGFITIGAIAVVFIHIYVYVYVSTHMPIYVDTHGLSCTHVNIYVHTHL